MDIFEIILKPIAWVFRIFINLLDVCITRPWYWIGWLIAKALSFGKFPFNGPNEGDLESFWIQATIYLIGFGVPIGIIYLYVV